MTKGPAGAGAVVAAVCLLIVGLSPAGAASSAHAEEDNACMGCHSQELSLRFENGETLPAKVNRKEIKNSVHAILGCSQCHDFTASQHPRRVYKSKADYRAQAAKKCTSCHTSHKTEIHAQLIQKSPKGTVCTDCHGSHAVRRAREMAQGNRLCLSCHALESHMSFKDGTRLSVWVDEATLNRSIHKDLSCSDCHFGFSAEEHPVRSFKTRRDLSVALSESCRRCHFDKYSKTLESIHFNLLAQGNLSAPVCTDCHGAHAVLSGRQEKLANARKCRQCHTGIYNEYVTSIHGGALVSEHNEDVPICSDCHKAHDVSGPHSADFRNTVPQMCGKCHADKEIMGKYGLSTSVVDTYLQDFHGVTLKFYKKENESRPIAVCTDCHGIHDIPKAHGADPAAIRANLEKRCRKCHEGAATNFPDSWISHYEPDLKRAPLVYLITLGYKIFIPFMIIGLLLQILLHIWRFAVNK